MTAQVLRRTKQHHYVYAHDIILYTLGTVTHDAVYIYILLLYACTLNRCIHALFHYPRAPTSYTWAFRKGRIARWCLFYILLFTEHAPRFNNVFRLNAGAHAVFAKTRSFALLATAAAAGLLECIHNIIYTHIIGSSSLPRSRGRYRIIDHQTHVSIIVSKVFAHSVHTRYITISIMILYVSYSGDAETARLNCWRWNIPEVTDTFTRPTYSVQYQLLRLGISWTSCQVQRVWSWRKNLILYNIVIPVEIASSRRDNNPTATMTGKPPAVGGVGNKTNWKCRLRRVKGSRSKSVFKIVIIVISRSHTSWQTVIYDYVTYPEIGV